MRTVLKRYQLHDHLAQRTGVSPICQMDIPGAAVRMDDDERMGDEEHQYPDSQVFMLCHAGIKPDGMEVVPRGMKNKTYRKNPVVFLNHRPPGYWGDGPDVTPPGRSKREWVEKAGDGLGEHVRGEALFGSTALGQELRRAYGSSFMNAVSIRWDAFDGKSVESIPDEELLAAGVDERIVKWYGGIRYRTWKLLEYSFVHLPMDDGAVAVRNAAEVDADAYPKLAHIQGLAVGDVAIPKGRALMRFGPGVLPAEIDLPTYFDIGGAIATQRSLTFDQDTRLLQWSAEAPEGVPAGTGDAEVAPDPETEEARGSDEVEVPAEETTETEESTESDEATEEAPAEQATPEIEQSAAGASDGRGLAFGDVHPEGVRVSDKPWNQAAAIRRLRSWAKDGGSICADRYRRAFAQVEDEDDLASYGYPHHDVHNGTLVSVRSGVIAACQKVMRGGGAAADGVKEHLAEECRAHKLNVPWETSSGRMYETAHGELARCKNQKEIPSLRGTIVEFAKRAFGDYRTLESWEERSLPAGDEGAWRHVAAAAAAVLDEAGLDADETRCLVDTMLERFSSGAIGDVVRSHAWAQAIQQRLSDIGIEWGDEEALARALTPVVGTGEASVETSVAPAISVPAGFDPEALTAVVERMRADREALSAAAQQRQEPKQDKKPLASRLASA